MSTPAWDTVGASVQGARHARYRVPNQDAFGVRELGDGRLLIAVSDGHGGSRYPRSRRGAELAVQAGLDVGEEVVPTLAEPLELGDLMAGAVWRRWLTTVRVELDREPLTPAEAAALDLRPGEEEITAYGATLMFVALGHDSVAALQIGDGDVVAAVGEARALRIVPGDPRLVGNATTSLCAPRAVHDFRQGALSLDGRQALVLVATDGYANSIADANWEDQVMADLVRLTGVDGLGSVSPHLRDWLAESAAAAGDDVTVVLARRRRPGPPVAVRSLRVDGIGTEAGEPV